MGIEELEAYANAKLTIYKQEKEIEELTKEIENLKGSTISIETLKKDVSIYDDSLWFTNKAKEKYISLLGVEDD